MTFRLTTEVALRRASILRNQGSARAAAGWPAKGSRGNLGLKTSLRERCGAGAAGGMEEEEAIAAMMEAEGEGGG